MILWYWLFNFTLVRGPLDYFLKFEQSTQIDLTLVIDSCRIEDLKIICEEELVAQAFEEAFKVSIFNYKQLSKSWFTNSH